MSKPRVLLVVQNCVKWPHALSHIFVHHYRDIFFLTAVIRPSNRSLLCTVCLNIRYDGMMQTVHTVRFCAPLVLIANICCLLSSGENFTFVIG